MTVGTIGHSTRGWEEFLGLLRRYGIEVVVDVRHFPGSRRYPWFGQGEMKKNLAAAGIGYVHLVELGGRRKAKKDSKNVAWRNEAFRGYADYMEMSEYKDGIERLLKIATGKRVVIMCSEAVWWRCHRSMIADDLKARGVEVVHILGMEKVQEHPYTGAARVVEGRVSYEEIWNDER